MRYAFRTFLPGQFKVLALMVIVMFISATAPVAASLPATAPTADAATAPTADAVTEPAFLNVNPGIRIECGYSEVVALLRILSTASGIGRGSEALAAPFLGSEGIVNDFGAIMKSVNQGFYLLPGEGKASEREFRSTLDALMILASAARDLDEFMFTAQAVIPGKVAVNFRRVLESGLKLYGEIYGPSDTLTELHALKQKRKSDAEGFLAKVESMMVSVVPERAIRVMVVPVIHPGKKSGDEGKSHKFNLRSQSLGTLQILEVVRGGSAVDQLDVLIHEVCHYLFRHSSKMDDLLGRMKTLDQPWGAIAAVYFEEALVTALGNGLAPKYLEFVRKGDKSWYADEMIDGFARALYPDVEELFNNKRILNQDFAVRATELFKNRFPAALSSPAVILKEITIFFQAHSDLKKEMIHIFQRRAGSTSIMVSSPIDHPISREMFMERSGTMIFLLRHDEFDSLKGYDFQWFSDQNFSEKSGNIPMAAGRLENGKGVFVLVFDNLEELDQMVEHLGAMEKIPAEWIRVFRP